MKYYAVRFNDCNAYLVEVDDNNHNYINDIEIDKETYEEMLKANQEKSAEIRIVKKNKKLTVADFYDRKPSDFHQWSEEEGEWFITKEKQKELHELEKQIEADAIQAERAKLMQEMQLKLLLGEQEEAKEIALKIKELDEAL